MIKVIKSLFYPQKFNHGKIIAMYSKYCDISLMRKYIFTALNK